MLIVRKARTYSHRPEVKRVGFVRSQTETLQTDEGALTNGRHGGGGWRQGCDGENREEEVVLSSR